jgi:predicted signal transduction protein with EAL and GGDEF domain
VPHRQLTRRGPRPSRAATLRAGVVVLALAAALAWLYYQRLSGLSPAGGDHWALWPFVAFGSWASEIKPVPVRSRRVNISVGLAELPVLVGLIYLSPLLLLTAVSAGGLAASAYLRRRASKALISQGAYALALGVGLIFYDWSLAFLGAGSPSSLLGWAAVAAAIALIDLLDLFVLLPAVSLAEWHIWLPPVGKLVLHMAMSLAACFVGGMMAALLIGVNAWTTPLYALVLWAAYRYYQNSRRALSSYAEVASVYALAREMIAMPGTREVMEAAAVRLSRAVHADRVEIVLPVESPVGPIFLRASYRYRSGVDFVEAEELSRRDQLVLSFVPFSERTGYTSRVLAECLQGEGFEDAMAASLQPDEATPLHCGTTRQSEAHPRVQGGTSLGELEVTNAQLTGGGRGADGLGRRTLPYGYVLVSSPSYHNYDFTEDDERLLQAMAPTLGVGLFSSEMLDGLRRELAAREYQAQHDPITGLPNRYLFLRSLEHTLRQGDAAVAVIFVNIDGFTDLNVALGHQAGDAVLSELACRLAELGAPQGGGDHQPTPMAVWFEGGSELLWRKLTKSKAEQVAARFDGDEFALVLTRSTRVEIEEACQRVQESLARPYEVSGLHLDIHLNVGAALALPGEPRSEAASLLARAEAAVRQAKLAQRSARSTGQRQASITGEASPAKRSEISGGSIGPSRALPARLNFYVPKQGANEQRQLALTTELRRSIEDGQLHFWYQPVIETGSGQPAGCEALLRLQHESLGPIPTLELIAAAEAAGLIAVMTWSALESSLRELVCWRKLVPELWVSVNLSGRVIPTSGFAQRIAEALSRHRLPPSALSLELTEAAAAAEALGPGRALHELRDMGVRLSLDDYGTGTASLSRLRDMPFTEIKIDGLFVRNVATRKADQAIVRSTIELAHSLGRKVTGEGVEDELTLARLVELGCDSAQGFYIARPLPAAKLGPWLQDSLRIVGHERAAQGWQAASAESEKRPQSGRRPLATLRPYG